MTGPLSASDPGADPDIGLSADDARLREDRQGPNVVRVVRSSTRRGLSLYAWRLIGWMLETAAVLSVVVPHRRAPGTIVGMLVVNAG